MTPQQSPDFLIRLAALGELFNAKLTEATQVLYFEALKDIDLERLIVAMTKAAKQCRFMPKPVELREFAIGGIEDNAALAWNGWKMAARNGGSWRTLICDGVTADAIEATFGTWPDSCALEFSPEMWANKRKEFISNYRIMALRTSDGIGSTRLLRGNGTIDDKWNRPMLIDTDGAAFPVSLESAREELEGSPDEQKLNRLLPS